MTHRGSEENIYEWLKQWQKCNDVAGLDPKTYNALHELNRLLVAALCPTLEARAAADLGGFVYLCTKCSGTTGDPLQHVCGDGS